MNMGNVNSIEKIFERCGNCVKNIEDFWEKILMDCKQLTISHCIIFTTVDLIFYHVFVPT